MYMYVALFLVIQAALAMQMLSDLQHYLILLALSIVKGMYIKLSIEKS